MFQFAGKVSITMYNVALTAEHVLLSPASQKDQKGLLLCTITTAKRGA